MRKIKLWVKPDYDNTCYEEIIEVEDSVTSLEIDKEARDFLFSNVSYGWYEVNDEQEGGAE